MTDGAGFWQQQGSAPAGGSMPGREALRRFLHWWTRERLIRLAGAIILAVATVLVYRPAMHGGMVWDDAAHLIPFDLQSLHGLRDIWFKPGTTQQYYPFTYTMFWLEHALWGNPTALFGDDPYIYHLANLVQHIGAALLVWLVLARLRICGAWLAALLFAVHPVNVESVAWMSEQKNTLSTLFYLGAMYSYLRFDTGRERKWYVICAVLFACGLLSKSVIATLPAALLVIFWWQRGKISFAQDVRPLLPLFAMGLFAGLGTAWLEYSMVGAHGADYQLSLVGRFLLAGRVVWFYLGKLFLPVNLMFYYPRWDVDPAALWQWLFPLAFLVVLAVLWRIRHRSRAPLAAFLFFVGSLFPALGFINIYPFRFSYVADHFQYLPSIGIFALVAGALGTWWWQAGRNRQMMAGAATAIVVVGLGVVASRQSQIYGVDAMTLYQWTLEKNPTSWVAHENLAATLLAKGDPIRAIDEVQEALKLRPNYAWAYSTWARALELQQKQDEARAMYEKALALDPVMPQVQFELSNLLYAMGKLPEAIASFEKTLTLQPGLAQAHFNLGAVLVLTADTTRALKEFEEAGRLEPRSPEMQQRLAQAYEALGDSVRAKAAKQASGNQ